ncbi:MAG TPA: hypothetical protein VKD90_09895 [Gemmataceae bacterium]|nr:hypothetical protein [Gemmataceae bacterium]
MPHSGENVRFQILVNGEVRGTAGLEATGVLTVVISWVRRDPAAIPEDARSAADLTEDDWAGDRADVHLGGLDSVAHQHLGWLEAELAVGDEVTVRLLPPGEFDPPTPRGPETDAPTKASGAA